VTDKLREKFGGANSTTVADEAFLAKDQYLGELCFLRKGRYPGGVSNLPTAQEAKQLVCCHA